MSVSGDQVSWPGSAVAFAQSDLAKPVATLLERLNVLEDPDELAELQQRTITWKTSPSLQVITSGATSLSKWVSVGITSLGGIAVVVPWLTDFWEGSAVALRIAYLAFVAVILSVAAIAIALVVRADVYARASAAAAQYEARAAITTAFLSSGPTYPEQATYMVKRVGSARALPVERFDVEADQLVAVTRNDIIPMSEIETIWLSPTTQPATNGS